MRYYIPLFFALLSLACDNSEEEVILDGTLEGAWELQEIQCYCAFEPETDFSDTRLVFDTKNDRVEVIDGNADQFFKQAGTYFYGGQSNVINFPDGTGYQFEVNGNQLMLVYLDVPGIADDEVVYFFRRP